jgi:putative GTP pyrophosphokinase
MIIAEAIDLFEKHRNLLDSSRESLCHDLAAALNQAGIKFNSLSSRSKVSESLRQKLARPDKTYESLWDVTDLIGLRVTTFFEDSIADVAKVIENRFSVDFRNTQDRLNHQDFKTFGYRSLHYVCRLNQAGSELPSNFRFEIQVRTILQHAWAQIEHDMGYKASDSTPDKIRRRFSRIAGLLELADEEFVSIRRDLRSYEASVNASAQDANAAFPLDRLSLQCLVQSPQVAKVDEQIATMLGRPLSDKVFFPEYLLKMLRLSGFRQSNEVYAALESSQAKLLAIIAPYFEFTREAWKLNTQDFETIPRGYSLFFLSHSVILDSTILEENKVSKLAQFYRELDYPDDEESANQVARKMMETLKSANYLSSF